MIKVFILKDYEYFMLLDCYYNPHKVSQDYFISKARAKREYHNPSHTFITRILTDFIYTHEYKIPSVFGARNGYATVRKILKLAKTHFFKAYERKTFTNDFYKKITETTALNFRIPYKISKGSYTIIILSRDKLNDMQCDFIASEVGDRKFLKEKHIVEICNKIGGLQ